MSSSTDHSELLAQRQTPAWKRLGLKLKSASPTHQPNPNHSLKDSNSAVKRKASPVLCDRPTAKRGKGDSKLPPQPSVPVLHTPTFIRKKSVSFTPETKFEDGDSIKQLFSGWVAEQKEQDPLFDFASSGSALQIPEPTKVIENIDATLCEKERRVKRVKRVKHPKLAKSPAKAKSKAKSKLPSSSTSRPFLQYLKQYHESRPTWKFNKNHQNHLIKHAFDASIVPSDHIHLLYEYIRGLRGSVRTRLRDVAFAIKVRDQEDGAKGFPEDMADKDQRQREYEESMKEYIGTMTAAYAPSDIGFEEGWLLGLSTRQMEQRVARRMRSERILAELSTEEQSTLDEQQVDKRIKSSENGPLANQVLSQKIARKRKQRTVVLDLSSSSESSSSSSSSEDESDAEGGNSTLNDDQHESLNCSNNSSEKSASELEAFRKNSDAESEERTSRSLR